MASQLEYDVKVGLEVHLQLATEKKLFCDCSTTSSGEVFAEFTRVLRPTQSELGQVDPAALFEFKKGKVFRYRAYRGATCLVEMDEEPPHPINMEALKVATQAALLLNARPVDEVHVMRKIVIDGSNTTGFQRTAIVALGGWVKVRGKTVPIQTVCLEEDAARILEKSKRYSVYALDRLGIPLIEVSTAPVVKSPQEAYEVALAIGRLVKATGKVKGGLGSIRQDVNISVDGEHIVEVKGVQRLSQLRKVVEFEIKRQLSLLEIANELRERGVAPSDVTGDVIDVSDVFRDTNNRIVKAALREGKRVLAVKLPGFNDLLGRETAPGMRLGKELAERASYWSDVRGLFHTDEMLRYAFTEDEVRELRERVGAGPNDAVVFIADEESTAREGLAAVVERAREAFFGPPSETRGPREDGSTFYMRPRPGMARMYPETDVPPIPMEDIVGKVAAALPKRPDELVKEIVALGVHEDVAWELFDSPYLELFNRSVRELRVKPTVVASILVEQLKALSREGVNVEPLSEATLWEVLMALSDGEIVKESVPDVLAYLAKNPGGTVGEAKKALCLEMLSAAEIERVVREVLGRHLKPGAEIDEFTRKKLFGFVMREVRGRAKPKDVMATFNRVLEELGR